MSVRNSKLRFSATILPENVGHFFLELLSLEVHLILLDLCVDHVLLVEIQDGSRLEDAGQRTCRQFIESVDIENLAVDKKTFE